MPFKEQAEALDASEVSLAGDSWAAKSSELDADIVQAIKSLAVELESQRALIGSHRIETANSDLSNVSESDIVRRLVDNPASIRNGTMLQIRNALIEPLTRDTLVFDGGPDLYYAWMSISQQNTGTSGYIGATSALNTHNAEGVIAKTTRAINTETKTAISLTPGVYTLDLVADAVGDGVITLEREVSAGNYAEIGRTYTTAYDVHLVFRVLTQDTILIKTSANTAITSGRISLVKLQAV